MPARAAIAKNQAVGPRPGPATRSRARGTHMAQTGTAIAAGSTYNDKVVRQFAMMTVVWGIVGMLVGVLIAAAADLAGPELRPALADLQPPAAAAHQRGDLRLRRLGAVRHLLLRRAAHLPRAAVRRPAGGVHVLGLAAGHRAGGHHAAARHHQRQGIRRARMADRHADRRRLGRLRASCSSARSRKRRVKHIYVANWFFARLHHHRSRCCTSSTAPRSR